MLRPQESATRDRRSLAGLWRFRADPDGVGREQEADVTTLARPGAALLVTVAVDNVLTWETIPPGIVVDTPHGKRQKYMHDFFNYAGLHRPVWLYATPHTHLDDLGITTDVADPLAGQVAATVTYRAAVAGDRAVSVRARLPARGPGPPRRGQRARSGGWSSTTRNWSGPVSR